jgi:hypothetical protein
MIQAVALENLPTAHALAKFAGAQPLMHATRWHNCNDQGLPPFAQTDLLAAFALNNVKPAHAVTTLLISINMCVLRKQQDAATQTCNPLALTQSHTTVVINQALHRGPGGQTGDHIES